MKKLVSIGMLLASSMVAAGQQVQVTGTGYNLEEAKADAIQKALMKSCKSAVVSDKVFRNYKQEHSKVVIYNGCLVKNYTVDDESQDQGLARITITAEVVQNRLPDRILKNRDEWFFYDFGQHTDRTNQLRIKRNSAKALVNEIFLDFPYSAFNLERSEPHISYEGEQSYLNINFKIYWNKNFINALDDTFDILQDTRSNFLRQAPQNIKIIRPYVTTYYGFNHHFITEHVHMLLSNNRPQIRVRILDGNGNEQLNVCYQLRRWGNLYDLNKLYWININAAGSDRDNIKIPIPDELSESSEITMDVVTMAFCKDFVY